MLLPFQELQLVLMGLLKNTKWMDKKIKNPAPKYGEEKGYTKSFLSEIRK